MVVVLMATMHVQHDFWFAGFAEVPGTSAKLTIVHATYPEAPDTCAWLVTEYMDWTTLL